MKGKSTREVLVPASLLPEPHKSAEGRLHGLVTCVKRDHRGEEAHVVISDLKNVKIKIPWAQAQQYLIGKCPKAPKRARSGQEGPWGSPQKKARSGGRSAGVWRDPAANVAPAAPQTADCGSASHTSHASASTGDRARAPAVFQTERSASLSTGGTQEPVKKRRGRPPKPGGPTLAPPKPNIPRTGAALMQHIAEVTESSAPQHPEGTQMLAKVRGWQCRWPVSVWSLKLCLRKDMEQILESHKPGHILVRFYGERSIMWAKEAELEQGCLTERHVADLQTWGRTRQKPQMIEAIHYELECALDDPAAEVSRLLDMQKLIYSPLSSICAQCLEEGPQLQCSQCQRAVHNLCLKHPCLSILDLPEGCWVCPCCSQPNVLPAEPEVEDADTKAKELLKMERMGLTPDWIIQVAVFTVLQLPHPSPAQPYIKGLLDPCTNSMTAPNIPAEKLYDKKANGLLTSNSWAGYHVLLNPEYSGNTQWRFVNRAIDEVENDRVPAVILVCRNSTDTAYFQRLRPYPRIMLLRYNTRFKDYDKTPIGFGVAIFCIAKASCRELYERFYDGFASHGEPNIPFDKAFLQSNAFYALLSRLKQHVEEHQRDHWVQCSMCCKWRIVTYELLQQVSKDTSWTCRQLRPPLTTCSTPQTRKEMAGSRGYAAATPGVPLWSPLAPLLPPNELRLLDSSSSDVGLDIPMVTASSAEIALAEARLEDSMAAAAAAAVGDLHALADAPPPGLEPAETMGSGMAASGVLEGMLASEGNGACAVERSASHCSFAVQPAQLGVARDQASTENAARNDLAEDLPLAPNGKGLCDTVSNAVQMLEATTVCTSHTHGPIAPADDMAAEGPGAEIRAATGGCPDLSAGAVHNPSQASDRSAVQIPDDSETPRSVCTGAPAAEGAASFSEAPPCSPEDAAAGAKDGAKSSPSLLQPKFVHQEPAMAEAQEAAMRINDIDASALDLARNARSIASKAAAAPLSVDHPLVRQAALELSRRASIEKATLQLKAMERQCSVGERIRAIKRTQLASALAALDEQGRQAASDLAAARLAMQTALEHP